MSDFLGEFCSEFCSDFLMPKLLLVLLKYRIFFHSQIHLVVHNCRWDIFANAVSKVRLNSRRCGFVCAGLLSTRWGGSLVAGRRLARQLTIGFCFVLLLVLVSESTILTHVDSLFEFGHLWEHGFQGPTEPETLRVCLCRIAFHTIGGVVGPMTAICKAIHNVITISC